MLTALTSPSGSSNPLLEWLAWGYAPNLLETLLLVLLVLLGRWLAIRKIRRSTELSDELRRRWLVQVRNVVLLTAILGLLIIWGAQIRGVALSAVAIAAAIVLATKELIMCVSGTLLEGSARGFAIGDRIEVAGYRGDVYDQTLLTTTLLEIGPLPSVHQYSGRTLVLPNSLFLSNPIINETSTDEYILHVFSVPMRLEDDWEMAERRLLEAANAECASFVAEARRKMEQIGRERGLRALSVEPRVTVQVPEPGRVNLVCRIPVPVRGKGRIEQSILRRVMPVMRSATERSEPARATGHGETPSAV